MRPQKTFRRIGLGTWAVVALLAAVATRPVGLAADASPASGEAASAAAVEAYRPLAEAARRSVDVEAILADIERLDSAAASERESAIASLRATLGLDLAYEAGASPERRALAVDRWQRYGRALRAALDEKIPLLLQPPTRDNENARELAAGHLGTEAAHPAFLPLLRAVVENEAESHDTRYQALTAVSRIPHPGVVPYLIEHLSSDELAGRAWEQLNKLTGAGIQNDTGDWLDVQAKFSQWWRENREGWTYDRDRVMFE